LQEQESFVGGAELENINILQRLQGIQLLGKELVMGSNVTPSIHPAGVSRRAAKIAPVWKTGHAVRNTVGMFQDTHIFPSLRNKIYFTRLISRELLDLFNTKKQIANAF
jgi:hypothetical protein